MWNEKKIDLIKKAEPQSKPRKVSSYSSKVKNVGEGFLFAARCCCRQRDDLKA